jgi:hypothetical protein
MAPSYPQTHCGCISKGLIPVYRLQSPCCNVDVVPEESHYGEPTYAVVCQSCEVHYGKALITSVLHTPCHGTRPIHLTNSPIPHGDFAYGCGYAYSPQSSCCNVWNAEGQLHYVDDFFAQEEGFTLHPYRRSAEIFPDMPVISVDTPKWFTDV